MKKKERKDSSTDNTILINIKTLIILSCLLVVLSIISITISSFTLYKVNHIGNVNTTEEEEIDYDVSMFDTIDTDKFVKLFKSDKKSLIYLGRSTCGFCVKFLPNLQKAQKEFGYKTYYLDITTVDDKGVEKIQGLDKFLKDNYGYTPMVLVVKNGKILNEKVDDYDGVGYTEYDTLKKFLKKLGYEK